MKIKKLLAGVLSAVMLVSTIAAIPSVTANAADATLLNTYGVTYGHMGTCINSWQLKDSGTMSHVKSQYNSITLENEMKPDALLGNTSSLMTVAQAKNAGYYIPDNYTETYVPKINFATIDEVLKICSDNGIGVRAHTLVWHSQTPTWFFRYGYASNQGFVNSSMMDARMEMYIKTVMNHVYSGKYGNVVYAWDVVNEYFHATNSGWEAVYGKGGTKPGFVKKAFQYAYDTLKYFKLTDKVSLFYNDFNTYMEVNDVITMINFINSNGKICNGVGMQSHLGTTYPSVDYYTTALKSFLNAGFEVQITELDVTNSSSYEQANYIYNLMKNVNALKKSGGKITSVTIWGLSDDVSWIKDNKNPLLFSKINVPKDSYYKFLQAYTDTKFQTTSGSTNTGNTSTGNTSNTVSSANLSEGWYYIKNVNAQKYLAVANNSATNGQNVELANGNGADGQKWYLKKNNDGTVTLKSALGFMLDVTGGKSANVTNIEIWNENSKDSQKFILKDAGNGRTGILTKSTNGNGALDPANAGKAAGTNIQQYTYYGTESQLWTFEKINTTNTTSNGVIADGWYYIKNQNAQKYLQVAGNRATNAANVEISTGTGVAGQKWYVQNTGDGYVTLKSGLGLMLDLAYGKDEDGTNLQIYPGNGADAQKFKISSIGNNQYTILTKSSNGKKCLDVYD